MSKRLGRVQAMILEALRDHPEGLDIHQIRSIIDIGAGDQQHLDRRVRDLDPHFLIDRGKRDGRTIYILKGERPRGEWDYEVIPKQLRAQVLFEAGGRCQMCGRTVKEDKVRLHVDHRTPRSRGGQTVSENLWAICSACNEGKKDMIF